MWRDCVELGSDVALIAATNGYATWLAEHKQLEPDWTWAEVALGTSICLLHSAVGGALHGGDWKAQQGRVLRSFGMGCVAIVLGEVRQYRRRQAERQRYQQLRA